MRSKCNCGNLVEKVGTSKKTNEPIWGKQCRTCRGRTRYGIVKGSCCEVESCRFVAIVSSQLEIDHIDGNRLNNDKSNLRTLCCNCHALKSHQQDMRFVGEDNPFFNKKHSESTLNKIRAARKQQNKKVK